MVRTSQFLPFLYYESYYRRPQLRDAHLDFVPRLWLSSSSVAGHAELTFRKEAAHHIPTREANVLACVYAWHQRPKYHRSLFTPALRTARSVSRHVLRLTLRGKRRHRFLSVFYWERAAHPQFFAEAESVLQSRVLRVSWPARRLRLRAPLSGTSDLFAAYAQQSLSLKLLKNRVLVLPRTNRTAPQRSTWVRGLRLSSSN